jgi:hypothetical protein
MTAVTLTTFVANTVPLLGLLPAVSSNLSQHRNLDTIFGLVTENVVCLPVFGRDRGTIALLQVCVTFSCCVMCACLTPTTLPSGTLLARVPPV